MERSSKCKLYANGPVSIVTNFDANKSRSMVVVSVAVNHGVMKKILVVITALLQLLFETLLVQ